MTVVFPKIIFRFFESAFSSARSEECNIKRVYHMIRTALRAFPLQNH